MIKETTKRDVLYTSGSEEVVSYDDGYIYVEGAGYQFKVNSLVDNNVMTSGAVRAETMSFLLDYYTINQLDYSDREEWLNLSMKRMVYIRDEEWLTETIEDEGDFEDDSYYNDSSLSSITDLLWDVFTDCKTRAEVDVKLNEILGYYSGSMVAFIEGYGYYIFFE